jgi:hypothetical protein
MSIEALQQVSLCRGLDRAAAERLSSVSARGVVSEGRAARAPERSGARRVSDPHGDGRGESRAAGRRLARGRGAARRRRVRRDGADRAGVCTASVLASSNVEGWFIGGDDFRAMVASREPVALEIQRAITHNLAAKLRVLNAKVREHAAQEDRPVREAAPQADPLADVPRTRRASFDWRKFLPAAFLFRRLRRGRDR